jgi:hypothetical protein
MRLLPTNQEELTMKIRRLAMAAIVPGAFALAACQPVPIDPEECRGTIGAITVQNVIVPPDATCTLEGTRVEGNAEVLARGTLIARGASIGANVQAEGHKEVRIGRSSSVAGSIQVGQGAKVSVNDTRITGDLQVDANSGPIEARRNRVGGSIQIVGNRGANVIDSNRVAGNLQCKENLPAPTGSGNVVEGVKEDQCRRL